MATKSFLKASKAPLLLLGNPFLAAAPPKTAAANTPIIQSFQSAQSSTPKPLFEPSSLSRLLCEEPSEVEGFGFGGVRNVPLWAGDSSFGLQVRAGAGGSCGATSGEDDDEPDCADDDEKTDWWSDEADDDDDDDESD